MDGTEPGARRTVLVTDARSTIPPIDSLSQVPYLTSRTVLDLCELPRAPAGGRGRLRRLPVRADAPPTRLPGTLVQWAGHLLPTEDPDISAAVAPGLAAYGIEVLTGTTCVPRTPRPGGSGSARWVTCGGPMFIYRHVFRGEDRPIAGRVHPARRP